MKSPSLMGSVPYNFDTYHTEYRVTAKGRISYPEIGRRVLGVEVTPPTDGDESVTDFYIISYLCCQYQVVFLKKWILKSLVPHSWKQF